VTILDRLFDSAAKQISREVGDFFEFEDRRTVAPPQFEPRLLDSFEEIGAELFGVDPRETTPEQAERILREMEGRGLITQEQLEANTMVDFNTFMSIGLSQCGSDKRTFGQLVEVWNNEKDDIRNMTAAEVRRNLTCP